ncbi:gastrula zinc finger protein XlCGF58.1-like [Erpetoichthys calabaricus]|uniref:gastrula zinc finger protein XlCGF58.1-like n=1 Tax=Erpetoichthys calabaricus TaxID=27687 RepID=UPI002234687A|nr:gastrula zinc finger protein XlCGF58.1-like [Erpetoichthys calabaricus]
MEVIPKLSEVSCNKSWLCKEITSHTKTELLSLCSSPSLRDGTNHRSVRVKEEAYDPGYHFTKKMDFDSSLLNVNKEIGDLKHEFTAEEDCEQHVPLKAEICQEAFNLSCTFIKKDAFDPEFIRRTPDQASALEKRPHNLGFSVDFTKSSNLGRLSEELEKNLSDIEKTEDSVLDSLSWPLSEEVKLKREEDDTKVPITVPSSCSPENGKTVKLESLYYDREDCSQNRETSRENMDMETNVDNLYGEIHTKEKNIMCGKMFKNKYHQKVHTGAAPQNMHNRETHFACTQCPKKFKTRYPLHRHQQLHTGERPCGSAFLTKLALEEHLMLHNGESLYNCSECKKEFLNEERAHEEESVQLAATEMAHHTCAECGKQFSLQQHYKPHSGERPYYCDECGKRFITKVRHLKIHMGENLYTCSECAKSFTKKANLHRHQKVHSRESQQDISLEEGNHVCTECSKVFNSRYSLQHHQSIHTGENGQNMHTKVKRFACTICGKMFSTSYSYHRHEKIHSGEKPFSCAECGKQFTHHYYLVAHQKIHTRKKLFSCTECGKSFVKESSLQQHLRVHSVKSYCCAECGLQFKFKSKFERHQTIHTGYKPYSCPECGRRFLQKSHLQLHQRFHTGVKKYECPECGLRFTWQRDVQKHQQIHIEEKPYSCSDCGKSFAQRNQLKSHRRIHSLGQQYDCTECGMRFAVKWSLRQHMKIHAVQSGGCPEIVVGVGYGGSLKYYTTP